MLCIGLITIGTTSAIGGATNSKTRLVKPLLQNLILRGAQEDSSLTTGGILYEDFYEIEILGGNTWQIKKLQRLLKNNFIGFFRIALLNDIDIKITYKKPITDLENSTEFYFTYLYEKITDELIDGSEILNEPHTIIIRGFTGVILKADVDLFDTTEERLDCFIFNGDYRELEILKNY